MNFDPSLPNDSRRNFVKKSLAASIIAAQPTILAGLIRAQGGGRGTGTTDPWGTTEACPTTDPWATTDPWETTEVIDYSGGGGMLCLSPGGPASSIDLAISLPDGDDEVALIIAFNIDTNKFEDPPQTMPYLFCSFFHTAQASLQNPNVEDEEDIHAVIYLDRDLWAVCDPTTGDIGISDVGQQVPEAKTTFVFGGVTYELAVVLHRIQPNGGLVTTEMSVLLAKVLFDAAGERDGFEIVFSVPALDGLVPKPSVSNFFSSN
ncbi:MAG: hypothetical protein B9S38_16380 [Verrucomicrobiia bacterium Tous-C4TDCM]|nr:MAG: hypothetical protein B9S38_16380 [Verrucomicrobiae bacterium Tous-C4TDCM]